MFASLPFLALSGLLLCGSPNSPPVTEPADRLPCDFHEAITGHCADLGTTPRYRLEFPSGWKDWYDPEIYDVDRRLAPPVYHLTPTTVSPLTRGWTTTHRGMRRVRWQIESWQVTSSDFLDPAPDAHTHVQLLLSLSKPSHR